MNRTLITPVAGDVLFWSGQSLLDDLVQWNTMSAFDHVGIIRPGMTTFEALPGGVQSTPLAKRNPYYLLSRNQPAWPAAVDKFITDTLGDGYSYLNDVMAAVRLDPVERNKWQCAQLTIHVLRMLGEPVPESLDITPQAVLSWLLHQGYLFQYQQSYAG